MAHVRKAGSDVYKTVQNLGFSLPWDAQCTWVWESLYTWRPVTLDLFLMEIMRE